MTDRELLETGFGGKQIFVRDVNLLFGFCFGFIADAVIREEEKEFLTKWRYEHADDADAPLLRPVFAGIDAALANSVMTLENVFAIIALLSEGSGSRGVLLDGDDQHAVDYRVLSGNHVRRGRQ